MPSGPAGNGESARGLGLSRFALLTLLAMALVLTVAVLPGCTQADSGDTPGETQDSVTPNDDTAAPEATDAQSVTSEDGGSGTLGEDAPTTAASGSPDTPATAGGTQARRLAPSEGRFAICADCHAFFDPPGRPPATLKDNFSHEAHLDYGAECESCHVRPAHTREGINRPQMITCFDCHGLSAEARAPGECETCHPADFDLVPASHTPDFVEEQHPQVAEEESREYCALCHEGGPEDLCMNCHGLTMPHPADFLPSAQGIGGHVDAAHSQGDLCTRCHDIRPGPPAACYGSECHGS